MSPRELEAVAVAADALDGAGDPAALVVALVAELARRGRLPEREVAVALAGLIEAHPEGAGLVRVLTLEQDGFRYADMRDLGGAHVGSLRPHGHGRFITKTGKDVSRSWAADSAVDVRFHPTREAAVAALIAAQPEPRAVVRVRS